MRRWSARSLGAPRRSDRAPANLGWWPRRHGPRAAPGRAAGRSRHRQHLPALDVTFVRRRTDHPFDANHAGPALRRHPGAPRSEPRCLPRACPPPRLICRVTALPHRPSRACGFAWCWARWCWSARVHSGSRFRPSATACCCCCSAAWCCLPPRWCSSGAGAPVPQQRCLRPPRARPRPPAHGMSPRGSPHQHRHQHQH